MATSKTDKQVAIPGGIWKAIPGQLDEAKQIVGSNVGYGIAVVGTGVEGEVQVRDDGNQLGNGATSTVNKFAGITLIQRKPLDTNLEIDGYSQDTIAAPVGQGQTAFVKENYAITVVRRGIFGVKAEAILAVDGLVYQRISGADATTTENGLVLGGITSVNDVNTELIPNAIVRIGAAAFGNAVIEIL